MELYNTDRKTLENEVVIETYKSHGPGGQHKNTRETAVRLRHIPSGVVVIGTEHRSQARNKDLAFKRLQEKLIELNNPPEERVPTKVPRCAKEARLAIKKYQGMKKKLRKKPEIQN